MNKIKELDDQATQKLEENQKNAAGEKGKEINAKADIIRSCMKNSVPAKESLDLLGGSYKNAALADNSATGGSHLIPKTTSNDLITEPVDTNELRQHIVVTNESNLEVPRVLFSIDDDDYVADDATAKELKAQGQSVAFGRYKSKIYCDITDTMMLGTNANLVASVDAALEGGVAAKEVKMLYAQDTDAHYAADTKHMSFYAKDDAKTEYLIKKATADTKFKAIKKAIADLPKEYRKNAKIIMTYTDYLDIIETLANGNATLFMAPPESILGKPVIFEDSATIPIVGDLRYLQINYHPETTYDKDKNVKTGMYSFVLTNWYDIQFRLRAAFRLAVVTP